MFKIDTSNLKSVDYFGLTLYIPKNHNFVATDGDSDICSYTHNPHPYGGVWCVDNGDVRSTFLKVNHNGNWQESLVEYDAEGNKV